MKAWNRTTNVKPIKWRLGSARLFEKSMLNALQISLCKAGMLPQACGLHA
jgi:hypothetical protein